MHYVLTRSAYPAAYPLDKNRRRLELTRRVTARSLASQTERRWSWLVAVDPEDPLLDERRDVLRGCGVSVVEAQLHQRLDDSTIVPDGRLAGDVDRPGAIWRRAIRCDTADERIVTTRLDDDDALAIDAIARIRASLPEEPAGRSACIMPAGYRWHANRVQPMTHMLNMFSSLDSPGELSTIMDVRHGGIRRFCPVSYLDRSPGWLWVRHADTRSGSRHAGRTPSPTVMGRFDVDWAYLEGVR